MGKPDLSNGSDSACGQVLADGKDGAMTYKWIGAVLIVISCGGFGLYQAAAYRREERSLGALLTAIDYMACDLQYRLTPLPELCHLAARECSGVLREIFQKLSLCISRLEQDDAGVCMDIVLQEYPALPRSLRKQLRHLGRGLGRFDLSGQLSGLRAVRGACQTELACLRRNAEVRQKSYQTLALCAGTSLVILFA
jgi:stage III sporulation protein AB